MIRFFREFKTREDGAITVDWVVLVALILALGAALVAAIQSANGQRRRQRKHDVEFINNKHRHNHWIGHRRNCRGRFSQLRRRQAHLP